METLSMETTQKEDSYINGKSQTQDEYSSVQNDGIENESNSNNNNNDNSNRINKYDKNNNNYNVNNKQNKENENEKENNRQIQDIQQNVNQQLIESDSTQPLNAKYLSQDSLNWNQTSVNKYGQLHKSESAHHKINIHSDSIHVLFPTKAQSTTNEQNDQFILNHKNKEHLYSKQKSQNDCCSLSTNKQSNGSEHFNQFHDRKEENLKTSEKHIQINNNIINSCHHDISEKYIISNNNNNNINITSKTPSENNIPINNIHSASYNNQKQQENDNQQQIQLQQEEQLQPGEEISSKQIFDEEYFNSQDNQKLEEITSKLDFVKNCLSKDFGKLKRDGNVIENDSLLGVDKEINLTEKQKKQRDYLIHSLRRRSQIFLILNSFWIIIMGLTYLESEEWFKMKTLDSLSLNLLYTANGFTIMELVLWAFSTLIGLNGIVNFQIGCLKIYQVGVLITIALEFLTNIILINFVPLSFAKSLLLFIFHSLFLLPAKILYNAMLAFRSKYIPILYHCQQSLASNQPCPKSSSSQSQIQSQQQQQGIQQQQQSLSLRNINDEEQSLPQQNLDKQLLNQNNEQSMKINKNSNNIQQPQQQQLYLQQNQWNEKQQLQQYQLNQQNINNKQMNNIDEEQQYNIQQQFSKKQECPYQNYQGEKERKQIQSVVQIELRDTNLNKKQDINSFPAYEKNSDKNQQTLNISGRQIFYPNNTNNQNNNNKKQNVCLEINNNNKNQEMKQLKDVCDISQKYQRKETIISSSNAQGSQTTLPSNNCNHLNQNNPSQLCPNLYDLEFHENTL